MTLILLLVLPVIIMFFSTYATPSDRFLKNINVAFFNEDNTTISKLLIRFVSSFFRGKNFYTIDSKDQAEEKLMNGEIDGVIVIPKDFTSKLLKGEYTSLEYMPSVENLQTSLSVYRVLKTLLQEFAYTVFVKKPEVMKEFVQYNSHPMPSLKVRGISEENFDYPDLMMPGVVGLMVLITVMIGIGTSITREREKGTIDGIILTPVSRTALITAKSTAYFIVGILEAVILLIVGNYLTNVNFQGKLLSLTLFLILGIVSYLGIGILVSTSFKTSEASTITLVGLTFLMALTSSVFIPLDIMPDLVKKICEFSPLTQVVISLRKIIIAGYSVDDLTYPAIYLGVISAIFISIASLLFRKITK